MVAPLTPTEIIAALEKWGVPYHETDGWKTRSNKTGLGDVTGFMIHHTANDVPDDVDRKVVTFGRTDLPGPLCQFGGRDDGEIDLIAAGGANHAGGGDPDVLLAVQKESYGAYPPPTDKHHGEEGAVGGNSHFYGIENYYGATTEPKLNLKRYRVNVLLVASVIDALDKKDSANTWTAKSCIAHKEWSDWKVDPLNVDMSIFRADIQKCLDSGPAWAEQWYLQSTEEQDVGTVTEISDEVLARIRTAVIQSPDAWGKTLISRVADVRTLVIELGKEMNVDMEALQLKLDMQTSGFKAALHEEIAAALADVQVDVDADALTQKVLDGFRSRMEA